MPVNLTYQASTIPVLPNRCNFLQLKKAEQLHKIEKLRAKSHRDDPLKVERMIRQNREAEINHYVNFLRSKIESDQENQIQSTLGEIDYHQTKWIGAIANFRNRMAKTSFKVQKPTENTSSIKTHRTYDFRNKGSTVHHNGVYAKENKLNLVSDASDALGETYSAAFTGTKRETRQMKKGLEYLQQLSSQNKRYRNAMPYDGQEEVSRMENDFARFLTKERSGQLVMRLPEGVQIPNCHLSDYYWVRRAPKKLAGPLEDDQKGDQIVDPDNNKSGEEEEPDRDSHPISDDTLFEGEEQVGEEEDGEQDSSGLRRNKKKRLKKKYQQYAAKKSGKNISIKKPISSNLNDSQSPFNRSINDLNKLTNHSLRKVNPYREHDKGDTSTKNQQPKKQMTVALSYLV